KARPDLRPADDQLIALDPPARPDPGKVRPRAGLRKALAPYRLALEDARQVIGLLLFARVEDQRRPAMIDPDEVRADPRRVGLRIFLEPDNLLDDRQTAAAILGGPVDPRPAGIEEATLPGLVEIDGVSGVDR